MFQSSKMEIAKMSQQTNLYSIYNIKRTKVSTLPLVNSQWEQLLWHWVTIAVNLPEHLLSVRASRSYYFALHSADLNGAFHLSLLFLDIFRYMIHAVWIITKHNKELNLLLWNILYKKQWFLDYFCNLSRVPGTLEKVSRWEAHLWAADQIVSNSTKNL